MADNGDFNDRADELISDVERHTQETPFERAARHYIDNQIKVKIASALLDLTDSVNRLTADVQRQSKWMEGYYDDEGNKTPGVLDTVRTFRSVWKLIVGLLGATATASVANAIHTWLGIK